MIKDIPDWNTAIIEAKDAVLGNPANEPKNFNQVCQIMGKALELLLLSKNKKYGKSNMLDSCERYQLTWIQALMMRENDKTERIINHIKGVDLGKEGLIESFGDRMGYNALGIMIDKNWYLLPIVEEENVE